MQYLAKGVLPDWSGSEWPDDVRRMLHALRTKEVEVDVGPAGTVARFLSAALAIGAEQRTLTGTERMRKRPMLPLINALRSLGCNITCTEQEGFLPITVGGKFLPERSVSIQATVSSQFISALLMIAPFLPDGLEIRITGDRVSTPYIYQTLQVMDRFGVTVRESESGWQVMPGALALPILNEPERDWAAASYWLLAVLTSKKAVLFSGLNANSIQPDAAWLTYLPELGLAYTWEKDGKLLVYPSETGSPKSCWETNLNACPDLAPTLAMAARIIERPFVFEGLETLNKKESYRINVLGFYLNQLGADATHTTDSLRCKTYRRWPPAGEDLTFSTHEDHRMAMILAPLLIKGYRLRLDDASVVKKSYPDFWKQWITPG